MRHPLTKRQHEVFEFIAHFLTEKGYAPTLEEIGIGLGGRALATVFKHLTNLEHKGYIRRAYGHSRSIELVDETAQDHPTIVAIRLICAEVDAGSIAPLTGYRRIVDLVVPS